MQKGFTLVEVIISIFVLIIIGGIGISAFYSAKDSKNLDVLTDGLDFTLEQAKADAIAGKNASDYGVQFDNGSFTYFMGSSYTPGAATNKVTALPGGWTLGTTTSSGKSYIVFSHLTGLAQATGTIKVSKSLNPALLHSITIGPSGDITVVK